MNDSLFLKSVLTALVLLFSICQAAERNSVEKQTVLIALPWGDDAVTVSSDVDGEQVLFVTRLNANGDSSTVYRYSGMGEIVAASNGWGEDVAPFITVWMTATGYRVAVFVKRNGAVERAIEDGSEVPPEIRNIWRNGIRIGSSIQVTEISWVKGEDGSRHKRPSKTRTYEWIDSKFHLSETPWP